MGTTAREVSVQDRTEYLERKLRFWIGNLQANEAHYRNNGNEYLADRCRLEHQAYDQVLSILVGDDDDHIATLKGYDK